MVQEGRGWGVMVMGESFNVEEEEERRREGVDVRNASKVVDLRVWIF